RSAVPGTARRSLRARRSRALLPATQALRRRPALAVDRMPQRAHDLRAHRKPLAGLLLDRVLADPAPVGDVPLTQPVDPLHHEDAPALQRQPLDRPAESEEALLRLEIALDVRGSIVHVQIEVLERTDAVGQLVVGLRDVI